MGTAVEIIGLSKRYGDFNAIETMSLRVADGEFVTLLGPSGSGKTTMLSAIAGFVTPTAGQILIDGQRSDHLPPEARNLGVVFQQYALFPHMTVAENVAFPLHMRAIARTKIMTMVDSALTAVQMSAFGHRYPNELSGGQQQRIALARAMVFEPRILLLDEPLSALDKNLRESMQIELKRLHLRTGLTMIYVTHDQDEALLLSDRIVVMNHGRIEQIGRPEEIYGQPQNQFVAQFIGKSNFIAATVVDGTTLELAHALRCHAGNMAARPKGSRVRAMVRPEQVRLGAAASGLHNRFHGRLTEKLFLGASLSCRIELAPDVFVVATVAATQAMGALGGEIEVGWRSDDVLVFDE